MGEHTPGPWKIERLSIGSRGGSNTCWMIGPMDACIYDDWRPRANGISEAENEANARLIAAAPDLLAALENIRDTIESCYIAGGWVPLDAEEMESIVEMATIAIAKAKGESDE